MAKRILILGGTGEASALARRINFVLRGHVEVILSLAGRTRSPAAQPVAVRSGGFGGADGLTDYLRQENIALLVDATHPFAATMSANARAACASLPIPRLQWVRPAWTPPDSARVVWADTLAAAATLLPSLARNAFLAVGGRGLAAFAQVPNVRMIARAVEKPDNLPPGIDLVIGRPQTTAEAEEALFSALGTDTLVARESGGTGFAKIKAASDLGLNIVLIKRPPPEPGDTASSIEAALTWIAARL